MSTPTIARTGSLVATAGLFLFLAATIPIAAQDNATKFGVYDPEGIFSDATSLSIEHAYVPLFDVDLASIEEVDAYAKARNRELLITVEPFSWAPGWSIEPDKLREEMMAGAYDENIRALCTTIGGLESPTTIRFAQEMDMAVPRYPWAGWLPEDYISFYRHFYDVCQPLAPNAAFAWGPRGEENMLAYYPGDEYVDIVGVTLLSLQQFELDAYGRVRSLEERMGARYAALETLGKPIGIFEIAYHGDAAFESDMEAQMKRLREQFEFAQIVYFNAVDPWPWPDPYGFPDWRIESSVFD